MQIKSLVDQLEPAFASVSVEVKRGALMTVAMLVDNNLQSAYTALVNQTCNASSIRIKTEVKVENSQSGASSSGLGLKSKQIAATAHCHGQIGNEDVLNHSSKRAKTMLSASQSSRGGGNSATAALLASMSQSSNNAHNAATSSAGGGSASKRPDFLSQLKSIDSMQLSFPTVGQTKVTLGGRSSVSESRLQCIMCQETATDATAARCGHLGCEVCWKQWLKVNQSCPLCRKPASAGTVTRVIVKKS